MFKHKHRYDQNNETDVGGKKKTLQEGFNSSLNPKNQMA